MTDAVRTALARLADAGIPLLSQTVLLKGVNDNVDVLARLMRDLVRARVKPYYLHHLDRAKGTGHFRCSVAEGQKLVQALRGRLSGLCQPTYVLDIPGGHDLRKDSRPISAGRRYTLFRQFRPDVGCLSRPVDGRGEGRTT